MEGLAVGRVVHYVAYGTPGGEYEAVAHRAAIITEVYNQDYGIVNLIVFNPTGIHFRDCSYSKEPEPGTWHYPERV